VFNFKLIIFWEQKRLVGCLKNIKQKEVEMKEEFKLNLSPFWLLISVIALTLPVFLPSFSNPKHFYQDVIGTVTLVMNVLSFPFGLLALPVTYLAELFLNVNPNTIGGKYINVFLLCLLGYVQWFWIVPKLLQRESRFKVQNLFDVKPDLKLSTTAIDNADFCDSQSQMPVERIINEKNSKSNR
jgi:hypothetical protein